MYIRVYPLNTLGARVYNYWHEQEDAVYRGAGMPTRKRPYVLSTRVILQERALIRALAAAEEESVCEVLLRLLIPAVKTRLAQVAAEIVSRTEPLEDGK